MGLNVSAAGGLRKLEKKTDYCPAAVPVHVDAPGRFSSAAGQEAIPYVVDEAGILSGDEEDALEESASEIADRYACAPYILTVDDYTRYGSGDIFDTAMDIYEYLGS